MHIVIFKKVKTMIKKIIKIIFFFKCYFAWATNYILKISSN